MRADRLVSALLLLQQRGRVTAAELARELEVSVPTARRDLEALSASGIPVYPQPGRGGGWQLVGGARTDLSGLTAPEAQALFLLLGPGGRANPRARAALRKLAAALPAPLRADALAAADAVIHDPHGWGGARRPAAQGLDLLQRAVVSRRRVSFRYTRPGGEGEERVVDPWGVVAKNDSWYLIAGTEAGRRTYRVDRISQAQVRDEPADRPEDLDLGSVWDDVVAQVESRRAGVGARVRVRAAAIGMLHHQFGEHAVVGPVQDGWADAEVAARNVDVLARTLISFGGSIVVLDAPQVRARLVALAEEVLAAEPGRGPEPLGHSAPEAPR